MIHCIPCIIITVASVQICSAVIDETERNDIFSQVTDVGQFRFDVNLKYIGFRSIH